MRNFVAELKRRNVPKTAVLYIVGAWLIMQIVDVMFPALHLPRWTITLVAALQLIGFPIVIVLSWVYDVTPDGIRRTGEVGVAEPASAVRGKRMDLFIVAGLVVAIALLLHQAYTGNDPAAPGVEQSGDRGQDVASRPTEPVATSNPPPAASMGSVHAQHPLPASKPGRRSVAVLPFINLSEDPANEFFCDGISEELLNVLAGMPDLRVPSRTSTFAFKGKQGDVALIASALGVDYMVEGSVRKAGNQVRITAQLIEVSSDSHLWSQTFDRELSDIFAVQDEIARAIAEELRVKLDVGKGTPLVNVKTSNMQAYELYLRGRQVWRLRRREAVLLAEDLLLQAVALDPEFAHAWADLAVVYLVESSHSETGSGNGIQQAELAAAQALRLDDSLGRPRAVLASIAAGKRQFAESEVLFQTALEREPGDAATHAWYAILLSGLGRLAEAGQQYEQAVALDPAAPVGLSWMAAHELQLGDNEAALKSALRAIELGYEPAHLLAFETLIRLGEPQQAEEHLRLGAALNGLDAGFIQPVMQALANPAADTQALASIETNLAGPDQLRFVALLRDESRLAAGLRNLQDVQFFTSLPVLWDPRMGGLRQGPAFAKLTEDLELVGYWRDTGKLPDGCSLDGREIDCRSTGDSQR